MTSPPGMNRAVLDTLHEAVIVVDAAGRCVDANRAARRMLGVDGQSTLDDGGWRALDRDGRPLERARLPTARVLRDGLPRLGEVVGIQIGDAPPRWLSVNAVPVVDPDGVLTGVVSTLSDLTEFRRTRAETRRSDRLFSAAFSDAPIGMALVALDGGWLRVNRALCRLFRLAEDELLRRSFQELTHPEDLESDIELLQQTLAGVRSQYDLPKRFVRADGSVLFAHLSVSLIRDDDGAPQHLVVQVQDWTQPHALTERLERLANMDELTGLADRRRFIAALVDRLEAPGADSWVSIVDLDDLKRVNDREGHAAGDALLCRAARACRHRLDGDDLAARVGGNEFALLLRRDAATPDTVTDALEAQLRGWGISASVGTAAVVAGEPVSASLAAADVAMYEAKLARKTFRRLA